MTPAAHFWHGVEVLGLWVGIGLVAHYANAAHYGGAVEATQVFFAGGLISVVLLHVRLIRKLLDDERSEKRHAEIMGVLKDLKDDRQNDKREIQAINGVLRTAGLS